VFEKSKNGQKKCPIFKNPRTFGKQEFPEVILEHNGLNFKNL
jgi:hypothetical protein